MIIGHGGNIYETAQHLGCEPADIMDMSSNMNPLGPMPGLLEHLQGTLKTAITALPQADARCCVEAFAQQYKLSPENVLAANGTTHFIYTLPQALNTRRALIIGPTYADYADACRMHKVAYSFALTSSEHNFTPDFSRLTDAVNEADTVFICNPNNPTGVLIPQPDLTTLCNAFPSTRFVIDESYMPFVHADDVYSMMSAGCANVLVLNSMSKIFRLPGLRIGFLIAPPGIIDKFQHFLTPWSVNSPAQAAILYLMAHQQEVQQFTAASRQFAAQEIRFLHEQLQDAGPIKLLPSTTSFMLAELSETHTAASICEHMLKHRILLRNCSNFQGLSECFIRISIKTHDTNRILAAKLLQRLQSH